MCMAIYIGSNSPLPLVAWNEDQPDFYVTELDNRDEKVKVQFSKPYIYYVGSHTGCGCGFEYGKYPEYEDQVEESRQSVLHLSQYLTKATEQNATIELFACWESAQGEMPVKRSKVKPSDIGGESFWFEEQEFFLIGS